ncbi:MAG: hypothetical protein JJ896_13100 [Rhodothermales bacterium]|nr:hypothetical protein [Rhodothermales bacterium]MBO6780583.1 hypothetical protein [Rhodothermales bacterium]
MFSRISSLILVGAWALAAAPSSAQEALPSHAEIRAGLLAPTEAVAPNGIRADQRSIPLAFGLSALAPGAGQAYNRNWIKAAVAIGLEAAVFTVWSLKRSDGLSAEDDFRAFAHAQWDPVQYAGWLNDYVAYLQADFGHAVSAPAAQAPSGVDFTNPDGWSADQRAAVTSFFRQIQAIERQVFHPETGATFSHQLPGFGEQQYYELIGKYFQFAPGWADYPAWVDGEGNFTAAIDPELTGNGGSKPNVSSTFYRYAEDHAHAQDLLRTASRMSTLFVVNHLVAAIDAAVSAKLHNDRLGANMALLYVPDGPPEPSVSLTLRF